MNYRPGSFALSPPGARVSLRGGRGSASRFDTSASPLAAYLYERLGSEAIAEHVRRAREVQTGKRDWTWFVRGMPAELTADVAQAVAAIGAVPWYQRTMVQRSARV